MQPATFYHIYNRANGSENLFRNDENCHFFLQKFAFHINPIADTYAYCLMPNHFHFLVRIKDEDELLIFFRETGKLKTLEVSKNLQGLETLVSKSFSNLFNAYTKSYNKVFDRKGSLFSPNFKKKEIKQDAYFTNVIHYIHSNPVKHGFVKNMYDWPHSSIHSYGTSRKTSLKRDEVLEWFGGIEAFQRAHSETTEERIALEMEF